MNSVLIGYGSLAVAIVAEVAGTNFLMKSEQFSRLLPTLVMAAFYAISFFFLSQALKPIPMGVVYAIWGGLGIVLTTGMSVIVFKQTLDLPAILGIAMIVCGVIVVNAFSNSASH